MRTPSWLGLGLLLGLSQAVAQEPRVWRDPDQGCTYIITPQGGVGLRYRADGSPDCPETLGPATTGSTARVPSRVLPADGSRRRSAADARTVQPVAAASAPGSAGALSAADPVTTGTLSRLSLRDAPRRPGLSFTCQPAEGHAQEGTPSTVRVRVEPEARVMLVHASGGTPKRYTLDTTWDVWFNGRSERDPRLGIVPSPSRDGVRMVPNERLPIQLLPYGPALLVQL